MPLEPLSESMKEAYVMSDKRILATDAFRSLATGTC